MKERERSIWKNLLLALAATPATAVVGLIAISLIGSIDQAITKIQISGNWWVILITAYFLSVVYFVFEPKFHMASERKKVVNALFLYWEEQQAKRDYFDPPKEEIKIVKECLIERVKVWAWFDEELWNSMFPEEKYSEYIFSIVDNFIAYWENQKTRYNIKNT